MKVPDHYATLGVAPGSDVIVIRAAFKALMRQYHPDTNGSADATVRAAEINRAWSVLRDPRARASYDRACRDREVRPAIVRFDTGSIAPGFALAKRRPVSGGGLHRGRLEGIGNWLVVGLTLAALPFAVALQNSREQGLVVDKATPSEIVWPGAF
jgi:curved DNA-binding protein CbpA